MKQAINSERAPGAIGPYVHANRIGNLVFTSGQIPLHPASGEIPEGIEAQTRQSLENVRAILEEAGCSMESVVKATVFLSDMNNFAAMNKVYEEFFSSLYPARSAVEVARLPRDVLVEIEVIAHL